jgi:hypothetical protein
MTIDEYRVKILGLLKACSSEKEARSILNNADKVLDNSDISESSKKKFWINLYENLGDEYALIEKQASSSLSAIIAAAKEVIAKKVKG